jgi:hypothetical protein
MHNTPFFLLPGPDYSIYLLNMASMTGTGVLPEYLVEQLPERHGAPRALEVKAGKLTEDASAQIQRVQERCA